MRAVAAVLVLAACNQAFDLEPTRIPSEPVPMCPPIGETPRFTRTLTQVLPRKCDAYNHGARRDLAVAVCNDSFTWTVEVGAVDGPLAPAAGIPTYYLPNYAHAYTSPDESRIYFGVFVDGQPYAIDAYRRQQDEMWVADPALQFRSMDESTKLGAIASDGNRDRTVLVTDFGSTVTEYVIDTPWTLVRTTPVSALGVEKVEGFSLTVDGLRATFLGANGNGTNHAQYYTDRPSLGDAFRRGERLDLSYYQFAFMPDDCSRIYVEGVGSIFYAKQVPP